MTMVCSGFLTQGRMTAKGLEMPGLPFTVHPGHVNVVKDEKLREHARGKMLEQVIEGLTVQPAEAAVVTEPAQRDIIFEGSFDEVQEHFLQHEWSEGLPVTPPTLARVEAFLKYTDRSPEEIVGTLLPGNREATIWNIAVNGVMSGCRPEYMPVLIAIVEAMADPVFGVEHLGHTPGTETLIIVNGPIVKELGFNFTQAALRPGFQANTSIGRFWRMFMRNVAGFLPHKTDKGCFGGNFRIVLAENEDAAADMGWEPLSVDLGFRRGENVVTITSCTEATQAIEVGAPTAEEILRNIEARMADNHLFIQFFFRGDRTRPTIVLTPAVVKVLTDAGYTKSMVRQHFYENAQLWVANLSGMIVQRFYRGIEAGNRPEQIGTSNELTRYIRMVGHPDDILVVVSGDPDRDHVMICAQNGFIGQPVSRKVQLPASWQPPRKPA
ncbi:hypothetical protein [Caballeronia sp. ATUFL_M1_KS5A]|uniref:hypothetical protein n=1 Tax=Caballeronia sp. ATUFL_M1_KS5A TaxID=2921778 RepID=UPI0020279205|nr:hypothetical protein [Caballeronia sp. ATUFL_M1_KS5A]